MGRFERFTQLSGEPLFTFGSNDVTLIRAVIFLFLIVFIAWGAKRLEVLLQRAADRRPGVNRSSFFAVSRLLRYGLWIVGALMALHVVGIDLSAIALLTGAIGIGIGLGMQGLFNNIVSGFFLLGEKALRIGDIVSLDSGISGTVRNIGLRHTLVTNNDGGSVMVPNAELVLKPVTHWTLDHASRRLHINFKVGRGIARERIGALVLEAIKAVPETLTGPRFAPEVWLTEMDHYGFGFDLVVWVNRDGIERAGHMRAQYLAAIADVLVENDIPPALPEQVLHVSSAADVVRMPMP